MVGEQTARVWRLYLVGGALAFEEGRMGVDQILAVRRDEDGAARMLPHRDR
jgi:cyclopropane-fatty-acyl-phospholipid synthase